MAGHTVGVALGVEQGPAGPAVRLRPVQRGVGGLHQTGGRGARGGPLDHADRRGDREPLACQVERLLERGEDGAGQVGQLLGAGRVLDQDRELVAAQARHQPAAPGVAGGVVLGAVGEPRGDGRQQPVPGAVAQGVVDRLEAVQVQVAEADPGVLPGWQGVVLVRRGLQGRGEALEEQRPVGEPGHRVVHLEMAQPLLELPPVADVRDRQEHPGGLRRRGPRHRYDGDLGPQGAPVGVLEAARAAEPGAAAEEDLAVRVPRAVVGGEVEQFARLPPGEDRRRGPQQSAERLVGPHDMAPAVDDAHGERGGVERRPVVAQLGSGETGVATAGTGPGGIGPGGIGPGGIGPDGTVLGRDCRMTLRDRRCGRARGRACRGPRPFGGSAHRSLPL
ncbi:hypothetical protein SBADM41S_10596 [Streptomyces badius]